MANCKESVKRLLLDSRDSKRLERYLEQFGIGLKDFQMKSQKEKESLLDELLDIQQ